MAANRPSVFVWVVLTSGDFDVIRILADPLRASIVELLASRAACVRHVVEHTGAKQPTVSHHLRALREAGLVTVVPEGRFTFYRLVPDAFENAGMRLAELAARAREALPESVRPG